MGQAQVSLQSGGRVEKAALRFARRGWVGACVILLAAGLAAIPVWVHGPVGADDFEFHLISWMDAQHSWMHGIAYPHWATSPNFGAGEPRFVFYPPLTWMLGAAVGLVLPWALVPAAMIFLLLAAAGLATRALARTALDEAGATLAGCVALASGYALYTAYDRMAIGELAGGLWIPLVLLFILRDGEAQAGVWRRAMDGSAAPLALAVAGCWLSDAPVGVMGSYLLAGVALVAAMSARSWFPVVRAGVATALGIGLTAVYLIPAAWEQRWVDIQQATGVHGDPGLRVENNWLFPHHTDAALHLRDLNLHWVSPIAVFMIGVAMASVAALRLHGGLRRGGLEDGGLPGRNWVVLAIIPVAVLFLLLPLSLPVWNLLPKLRFLQFPWRWLLVVEAPMAVLFIAAVWPRGASRKHRLIAAGLCATFVAGSVGFAANHFFRDTHEDDDLESVLAEYGAGGGSIGTDEYAPPGADNTVVAMGMPDACVVDNFDTELGVMASPDENPKWSAGQGSCLATAMARMREPEQMRVSVRAGRPGYVVLRLRSFPAWRVTLNGQPAVFAGARADGLMVLPVEAGPAEVSVRWVTTPDVVAGRWVSGLALVGLLGLWLEERRDVRARRSLTG